MNEEISTTSLFVTDQKLFAVYLGGRAPRCNTELHDVVFVAGPRIEATYEQLMDKWFGDPLRLHIDSWLELNLVDGYHVLLSREPANQPEKLFFINLGAYRAGEFTELHANAFLVGRDEHEVKRRAKKDLLPGADSVHIRPTTYSTWYDCLAIEKVDGRHIHLKATAETKRLIPNNGYHYYSQECGAGLCREPRFCVALTPRDSRVGQGGKCTPADA